MDWSKLEQRLDQLNEKRKVVTHKKREFYPKAIYDAGGIDHRLVVKVMAEFHRLKEISPNLKMCQFMKALNMDLGT